MSYWFLLAISHQGPVNRSVFILFICYELITYLWFLETGSWCVVPGTHYVAQAGFKFTIILLLPPECWDYRCVPLHLAADLLMFYI
jgi:hypothetical protein